MTMLALLFLICFIPFGINEDNNFDNACNFTSQSQCGDAKLCHQNSEDCFCGNEMINILTTDNYCCVPPPRDGPWCNIQNCPEGEIINKTTPCNKVK